MARPSARESNAMKRPSGDHFGEPVSGPPKAVRAEALEPSASLTQISGVPDRLDSNASRRPSGENAGFCCVRLDEINRAGAPPARVGASSATCQMFTLRTPLRP